TATLFLTQCGGVGEDGSGMTPPDTHTTGVVNGFGSVVVNGIHFDVRSADIVVDGIAGRTQADLRGGMVVDVVSRIAPSGNTGTATRLVYESLLRGNIEALPGAGVVSVLGQRIVIGEGTLFSNASEIDDLQLGDRVQVSGFRAPDGSLHATWVAKEGSGGNLQLTAFISSITGSSVRLSGLDIDLATAEFEGVTQATLAAGQLVRVVLQAAPTNGQAVARKISLVDRRTATSLSKQQIEGITAQWDAGTGRFSLNGQAVQVNLATRYEGGTRADLATGVRIRVTGTLDSAQVLNAEKLSFFPVSLSGYARGRVTAVDPAGQRFNLLDNPGVEIRIRAETLLNDTLVDGGTLNLGNLAVGDEIVVLGQADGDRIDAELVTRLPRSTPGTGVGGPARRIGTTTALTILGTGVDTSGANYFNAQGGAMTQSEFFAALQQDDLVRAEGIYLGGVLNAVTVRRVR
ncbi:MAG TPA: DUF5666 domain-containing protein, partial [Rhizobacter sp.]|nr:DUF5666 domain-containing protein [Rhizobacter sp.]